MPQRLLQYFFMLSQKIPPSATSRQLIPVVALVFYHGTEPGFPEVIELQSLLSENTAPFQWIAPNIQIPIVNYYSMPWDNIPTNRPASMLECCLKARIDPQWSFIQKAMSHLDRQANLAAKTMLEIQRYLLYQIEVHHAQFDIYYQITQLPNFIPLGDTHMATIADWIAQNSLESIQQQWMEKVIQQGIEKGLQQGMENGIQQGQLQERQALIARLYSNGHSQQQIAEITGYDIETIQEILDPQ